MYRIQLEQLFNNDGFQKDICHETDLSHLDVNGRFPFPKPVRITGVLKNEAHIVTLSAQLEAKFYTLCDRCACDVVKTLSIPVEHTFITELNEEEDADRFIVVPDMTLDLDALVSEDLLLELPYKVLCREDCKGLCPQCGKNLNEGPCSCSKQVDPRLEALAALLRDDDKQ